MFWLYFIVEYKIRWTSEKIISVLLQNYLTKIIKNHENKFENPFVWPAILMFCARILIRSFNGLSDKAWSKSKITNNHKHRKLLRNIEMQSVMDSTHSKQMHCEDNFRLNYILVLNVDKIELIFLFSLFLKQYNLIFFEIYNINGIFPIIPRTSYYIK